MKHDEYITIRDLSEELKLDRSNLRKYVKKLGIETTRIRVPEYGNQLSSALTRDDADKVRRTRMASGFGDVDLDNSGWFYIAVPDPTARPTRVKLGYTNSVDNRLKDYRIANPEVSLLMKKRCRKGWEQTMIFGITNYEGCDHVGGEVYDVDPHNNVDPLWVLKDRCDRLFRFFDIDKGDV